MKTNNAENILEIFKKNVTIDQLQKDAEVMVIKGLDRKYFVVYPEFITYFKNIHKPLTKHDIIIGISFTYSWMPTILKSINEINEDILRILNIAKNGSKLNKEDLESLKNCFNNSLVGSSKLLHFINPEIYAIWDSRVYRYLTKKEPYNQVEDANKYLTYLSFCDYIISNPQFSQLHETIEDKVGSKLTKMRAIEFMFFHHGAKNISSLSETGEKGGDDGMSDVWNESQEANDYTLFDACRNFIDMGTSREKVLSMYNIDENKLQSLYSRFHTEN